MPGLIGSHGEHLTAAIVGVLGIVFIAGLAVMIEVNTMLYEERFEFPKVAVSDRLLWGDSRNESACATFFSCAT